MARHNHSLIQDNDAETFYEQIDKYEEWQVEHGRIFMKLLQGRCINCGREWNKETQIIFVTFKDGTLSWWHKPNFNIR